LAGAVLDPEVVADRKHLLPHLIGVGRRCTVAITALPAKHHMTLQGCLA
jgi:hypothetical protein